MRTEETLPSPIQYDHTSVVESSEVTMLKECRLGQYTVVVKLGCDGGFAGIDEIRVDSNFLSIEQQMRVPCLDVDKYYEDDAVE